MLEIAAIEQDRLLGRPVWPVRAPIVQRRRCRGLRGNTFRRDESTTTAVDDGGQCGGEGTWSAEGSRWSEGSSQKPGNGARNGTRSHGKALGRVVKKERVLRGFNNTHSWVVSVLHNWTEKIYQRDLRSYLPLWSYQQLRKMPLVVILPGTLPIYLV